MMTEKDLHTPMRQHTAYSEHVAVRLCHSGAGNLVTGTPGTGTPGTGTPGTGTPGTGTPGTGTPGMCGRVAVWLRGWLILVIVWGCLIAPLGQSIHSGRMPVGLPLAQAAQAQPVGGLTPDNAGPPPAETDEADEAGDTGDAGDAGEADKAATADDSETAPPGQAAGKAASKSTAPAASTTSSPPRIQLFGTVEFRRPLNTLPSWLDALARNAKTPILVSGSKLNAGTTWDDFKAKAQKLSRLEQLKMVNLFWNKWPYREDREVYGKPDYWAAPFEFRKNSGDCEDYAIVKYCTLRELGVPPEDMRIVVLMETIRNLAHAVLVVYTGGDAYVLDNLSNNVLSHSRYRNYLPQYSVNELARWAHVKPSKKK